jgi:copper homeostasis protein (lipoprotein)
VPSTFTGRIPCANCDGIDVVLNFRKDGLYQLRKTSIKGKTWDSVAEMGRWKYDRVENLIVLGEKRGALKTLTLIDKTTLRLLDVEGKKISSNKNYELHKSSILDPFPDPVRMRGMYSHLDGIGVFTECKSNIRFSVAAEKDNARLEHAYNTTPHGQGEPLLVSMEASLLRRPAMEDDAEEEVLVVSRFLKIFPNRNCGGNQVRTSLFNTTWKLVELDGKPVTLAEKQREPYFILETKNNKMHGFSGCNRFFGTYLIKGEIFVFNKMAATRMACMKGLSLEDAFLEDMK